MKCKITIYTLLCLLFIGTFSCKDDLYIDDERVGEGECVISGTVKFKPLTPTLNGNSRSAGDAIKAIKSLCVLLYNEDGNLVNKYPVENYTITNIKRKDENRTESIGGEDKTLPLAESETPCATFRLTVPYGKYYIYAVANMGDLSGYNDVIKTIAGLKNISLIWNKDDIGANNQMFGHFFSDAQSNEAPVLTINKQSEKLQAWVRRAASKVTVAFDGSSLKEGVSIYLKELRIKNIPKSCSLGNDNTAKSDENLIPTGEEVVYSESASYDASYPALITKDTPCYPRVQETGENGTMSWVMDPNAHSENNPSSLFFYENMQGTGPNKQQIDNNNDGILDTLYQYRQKPYATYIEVDAYYESTNPERPGMCNITYRFMLGQNVVQDYNAKRNCHYKLTLHFNGFADEPDWRIDYVTRLWVTHPETVDYRGKYFVPTYNNTMPNYGNTFMGDNFITVTSFMYQADSWENHDPVEYKIEYKDAGSDEFTETCPDWLGGFTTTHEGNGVYKLKIKYNNPYTSVKLDSMLSVNANKGGDLSMKDGKRNTANCYIVDAKGTYEFPLVYGNAITNDVVNSDAYTFKGTELPGYSAHYLKKFKNYKGDEIRSPYILEDTGETNVSASLVWQDELNLITDVRYEPGACSGIGGVRFSIGNIKEGNAVIALKDSKNTIMWSWHIWVTAIDFSEKNVVLSRPYREFDQWTKPQEQEFEIMPVNLGWCSGGKPIRYYDRHECEVRFTQLISQAGQEGLSMTVKIIQEPHVAIPCGNNPYFQWGRKDPFIAGGNADKTTKTWYDAGGNMKNSAPSLMYASDSDRKESYKVTADLIKNPDKWQNCPRINNNSTTQPYRPQDNIYFNLWDNSNWDGDDKVIKTIYDPCPAGYNVSSLYEFTGFTEDGKGITGSFSTNSYAVIEENMMKEPDYKDGIIEFYTNKTKLISLGFPLNGYRDWDDNALLHTYGVNGQIWHSQASPYDVPVNSADAGFRYNVKHFEFSQGGTTVDGSTYSPHIWPCNNYYATDGFPVRPTKTQP
ncbi:DUF4906 domain-containing protein [Butyricimonas hominis]|uniref:DUF4906 domain-containing protein n=1 Tax=Butyricimonas hominis TaxID=2763032 RepID=A0ABR7D4M6_9BACT|nr:DUF4906 domain-containing protein [Butyricimonas hominis]MBC5622908.1 DUF4906 domain-containing protein [Butyricimonas hominis]